MTESAPALEASPPRPYESIPRTGLTDTFRNLFAMGGGRIDMLSVQRKLYAEHGPVVVQRGGPMRMVNLFGPDANKLILLDRDHIFSARRPWMLIMGRIFPDGLLLRDGEDHKHHRKVMQAAFKLPVLRDYGQRMNPMIEASLNSWAASPRIHAFQAFKEMTLEMAASIFVGAQLGSDTRPLNRAFEDMVAASMSRIKLRIPGLEFYRGLKGREFMIDYFSRLLPAKRAEAGPDMLSRLCHATSEDGRGFDNQEIVDHMNFLMMAAHDTTTSTLTSMTYELARNPEWQERLREESRALGKSAPDFEDLDRLTAMTWTMKETLRRYPPLPVIPRIATSEFEFEGYRIPADTMVVVSPIHTHHMSEWWSDPFRFDPERFSPGRAEDERHTHSWIPFGGGPHICLGFRFAETQIRLIMHQMLQRYRWSVPGDYVMPVQQAPISKPRDGLPITLEALN
jgi:cytochrome P450